MICSSYEIYAALTIEWLEDLNYNAGVLEECWYTGDRMNVDIPVTG